MDSVRFGRALGIGARAAAKTLVMAADAAASPNPSASGPSQTRPSQETTPPPATSRAAQKVARTISHAKQTTAGVARGGRRFGEAVWGPFVKLSGVLWLEFTGVFFGIFAAFAASGAWKLRSNLHETATNHEAHLHLVMAAAMAVVFSYFCVSSFLRARRKERSAIHR